MNRGSLSLPPLLFLSFQINKGAKTVMIAKVFFHPNILGVILLKSTLSIFGKKTVLFVFSFNCDVVMYNFKTTQLLFQAGM